MEHLLQNKKASLKYEILERLEAGIELFGFEVKAIRKRVGSLEGSRVTIRGGEAYLLNATIPPYQEKNAPQDYDPSRPRRLLLSRNQLLELSQKESLKGLTLVPLSMYNKNSLIKVEIAVVRGKKAHDRREDIKRRDSRREIERSLKSRKRL